MSIIEGDFMISIIAMLSLMADPTAVDYGTKPTYEEAVKIGEAYIKHDLADPYSAHVEWPYDFVPFTEKIPLFKRTTGYVTCGTINAKNQYGGYVGERTFRIIIRDGQVADYVSDTNLNIVPSMCKEIISKYGMLPHLGSGAPSR
jgi:hypothetical protein